MKMIDARMIGNERAFLSFVGSLWIIFSLFSSLATQLCLNDTCKKVQTMSPPLEGVTNQTSRITSRWFSLWDSVGQIRTALTRPTKRLNENCMKIEEISKLWFIVGFRVNSIKAILMTKLSSQICRKKKFIHFDKKGKNYKFKSRLIQFSNSNSHPSNVVSTANEPTSSVAAIPPE